MLFRSQFRVFVAIAFAVYLMPILGTDRVPNPGASLTFFMSFIEISIGAFIGFVIRLGFMVVDVASEIFARQGIR